jgi:hypothetical protein
MGNMTKRFLAAALLWLSCAFPAQATIVLPLYLDEIVADAAVAFEGTCVGNRTEREAATNLVVTYTTFAVRDVLKGDVGKTHVIKQVGGESPDGKPAFSIPGVPKFAPGEDYVVMLAGISEAGFSSPIGLQQGRFGVRREAGAPKVGNGRDFRDLTQNLPPQAPDSVVERVRGAGAPVRELGLSEFKELVRSLGRGRP